MKRRLKTVCFVLILSIICCFSFLVVSPVSAQNVNPTSDVCSTSPGSAECVRQQLGIDEIDVSELVRPVEPGGWIRNIYQIFVGLFLATIIFYNLYNALALGISGGWDKAKEVMIRVVIALIALVFAIFSPNIVAFVAKLAGNDGTIFTSDYCDDLPPNASDGVRTRCANLFPDTSLPTQSPNEDCSLTNNC